MFVIIMLCVAFSCFYLLPSPSRKTTTKTKKESLLGLSSLGVMGTRRRERVNNFSLLLCSSCCFLDSETVIYNPPRQPFLANFFTNRIPITDIVLVECGCWLPLSTNV